MSVEDIAYRYECSASVITSLMDKNDMKRRSRADSIKLCSSKISIKHRANACNKYGSDFYKPILGKPVVGMIRSSKVIGRKCGAYIWAKCSRCGVERWMQYIQYSRSLTKGWCRPCSQKHNKVLENNIEKHMQKRDMHVNNSKMWWANDANRKMMLDKFHSVETLQKHSIKSKKVWSNIEYKNKVVRACRKANAIRPTKPEQITLELLEQLYPNEWKYVGNGDIVIEGKNPDIINVNGKKAIIEVFGRYWHSKEHRGECPLLHELELRDLYNKYGYDLLVVWDMELKDKDRVAHKISKYYENTRVDII
jgi:G:T-mismatch repair DNA endonuclease (very short patch repair protein)